jgi:protoheme IX farnesyltransferase
MKRTADRPVAAGRMTMSTAIMIGGILFVVGIILLAFFNPLAAVLGATAMVSYAFLYTPMKRISPMSVFVGAIPGALPAMIGVVAFEGSITSLALVLFGIQFFWQFPHFWSIGYLGFEDYKKAGFKLVPELDGEVHPQIGLQSMIFAFLLLPFSIAPYLLGTSSLWACLIVAALGIGYAYFGWLLHTRRGVVAARSLMFYSFAYLPIVLFIYYLGNL